MELQAESERIKRSKILHSEGEMMSKTNIAEANKLNSILDGQVFLVCFLSLVELPIADIELQVH